MSSTDTIPDTVVFDAEPLIAYFCDEPGSDTVEPYLEAVEGTASGYISAVTLSEIHYMVREIDGDARTAAVVDILDESGIRRVDTAETWRTAANLKFHHSLSLDDAYALSTADHVDGTLLVGADDDFDAISEIPTTRFRTEPA